MPWKNVKNYKNPFEYNRLSNSPIICEWGRFREKWTISGGWSDVLIGLEFCQKLFM